MKRTVSAVLTSLVLLQPCTFARESPATNPHDHPLESAIALEARRLAASAPTRRLGVPPVAAQSPDRRRWCSRHPVGCGTLIGLPAGFLVGVASSRNMDYDQIAYGLFFGAPIGAGIGAAVGGIIEAVR